MENFPMLLLFSFILFFVFPHISHSAHRFSRLGSHTKLKESLLKLASDAPVAVFDPTRVTQISWRPRAFLYRKFLAEEECVHLIDLAKDKLEKSMVADNESGKSVESEVRTSSGMFLAKHQDGIVSGIEARIAAWTFLPEENGESMQVLHYEHGQKYESHFDFFHDKVNQELGGHRIATVLMYLSNVKKGGETIFPESTATQVKGEDWSECARRGYAVKPMKGDALLFFSLHPNATTDNYSLHGSCPVIEGEKWSATKWIHVRSFDVPPKRDVECIDENKSCPGWAAAGECRKNPRYMVGSKRSPGYCRRSCKGSSGRIWDKNLKDHELKHDCSPLSVEHYDEETQPRNIVNRSDSVELNNSAISRQPITSRSKSERKAPGWGCASILGTCTKPRASA